MRFIGTRFRTESESHESRETWETQVQGEIAAGRRPLVEVRYRTVEELLAAARGGAVESPRLPRPGSSPPTERPG